MTMVVTTEPWSGWASTLVGSIVGGLLAAGTVVLAFALQWSSTKRGEREQAHRAARDRLIEEVSNLRDACARTAIDGTGRDKIHLSPLRNALYVTQTVLRGQPDYVECWSFYEAAKAF